MTRAKTMLFTASPTQAYFVLAIGVASASMAAIFIKLAQGDGMPSLVVAAGRLSIASLLLTLAVFRNPAYIAQIRGLSRRDLWLSGISGLFLAIHFASWISSLEYTTVLVSVVFVSASPIWVALLEVFFLRVRLSQMVMLGLAIAIAGGLMIGLAGGDNSEGGSNHLMGAFLASVGAVTVAVYLVIGRSIRRKMALTPYIWLVYGTAAIFLILAAALSGNSFTGYSLESYGWVIALGLVPQLIGHSSFNYALAYLPATIVSVASQMEPVFGAIAAYFIFKEIPGSWQVVGAVIIIAGVTMASFGQGETTPVKSQELIDSEI